MRTWRAVNRDRVLEINRSYYRRNKARWGRRDPAKKKAEHLVYTETRAGRLTPQPCEVGTDCLGAVQAHHDDYSKPLDIRWLCRRHHALEHMR